MIEIIFSFIFFAIACMGSFYVPGRFLTLLAYEKDEKNMYVISWFVGISFFLLLTYTTSWLQVPYLALVILVLIDLWMLIKKRWYLQWFPKVDNWSLGIILFGSLSFFATTALSGILMKDGMHVIGSVNFGDAFMHLAFIETINRQFPPMHASLAGYQLRGYHYFYDLLMSRFSLFYDFSPADLYYRLFSLLTSLVYGFGFYVFSDTMAKNKFQKRWILLFAYFAESSAFIYQYFNHLVHAQDGLGLIPPLESIDDPSVLFAIGLLLVFGYMLLQMKDSWKKAILVGLVLGILCEMKVYIGFIGIGAIILYSAYKIIFKKAPILSFLVANATGAIITIATFFPNNLGASGLLYAPLFLYENFMQEREFSSYHWEIIRVIYSQHHNIPRLIQMYAIAIGWFWLLALGLRLLPLVAIKQVFQKKFWQTDSYIFTLCIIGVPILVGSLFIQSVSIFDTKQFFWVAAFLCAIPAGMVAGTIFSKSNVFIRLVMIAVMIYSAWGGYIHQESIFTFSPLAPKVIPTAQLDLYAKIEKIVPAKDFIIVMPPDPKMPVGIYTIGIYYSPLVAAFTNRTTYYEPEVNQFGTPALYENRKKIVFTMSQEINACKIDAVKKEMKKLGSPYLVTFSPHECIEKVSSVYLHTQRLYFYKI